MQAEHHHRALQGIAGTRHRVDHAAQRYGILTTEDIKHAMCTLLDTMLREERVSVMPTLLSEVSLVFVWFIDVQSARMRIIKRACSGIVLCLDSAIGNRFSISDMRCFNWFWCAEISERT